MLTWTRARLDEYCGNCGATIARGDAVLEITIAGLDARRHRCTRPTCAGPAPADLPPLAEHTPTPRPPSDFVAVRQLLPLDWRRRDGEN